MLDTHVAVALFEGRVTGFSAAARRALDQDPACMSPAVLLELELLHEIRRIRHRARIVAHYLDSQLGIGIANERFSDVSQQALDLGFTRDPFDRLIVAHAALRRATLVTLDAQIHVHYTQALG